jgi:hypothetical protein
MKVVSFLVSYHVTCAGENSTPFSYNNKFTRKNIAQENKRFVESTKKMASTMMTTSHKKIKDL